MSYYPTIEEDLKRAREILEKGKAHPEEFLGREPPEVLQEFIRRNTGYISGGDTFAAYKLLESFVGEIERLKATLARVEEEPKRSIRPRPDPSIEREWLESGEYAAIQRAEKAEAERDEWQEQARIYCAALLDAQGGKFHAQWEREMAALKARAEKAEEELEAERRCRIEDASRHIATELALHKAESQVARVEGEREAPPASSEPDLTRIAAILLEQAQRLDLQGQNPHLRKGVVETMKTLARGLQHFGALLAAQAQEKKEP